MRALRRIWHFTKVMASAKRNRTDLWGWLIRRPMLLLATLFYEFSLIFSNRLDPKYKELAELKAAGLINCEYCLDIGSALAHHGGLTEQQIRDLPKYKTSDAYTDLEKLVIGFAEAMTVTPAVDLEEIRTELLTHFTRGQLAELAGAVAWENQRARVNQALGVRPTGIADGMVCAIPER
ncbi:carboxymuconolactone decarboxylase family protein [Antrihabitans sp. YC3-6]|uniref:Carboxymuconolactone decarboxylase family protein n=1 Tax=Antrihabitans stalagmiti TaxID=2799499 RepID=A0A934NLL4_9NOCA|nr:carboxymuconolactone decarboxylase family protein [Antrihabitans stalagmiti]MBJ8337459.1 carboxymuconolactone decarboxylase family protein [Antrihabitans stalagmiti]